jgi:primosomal protein N' (replication factor Y)
MFHYPPFYRLIYIYIKHRDAKVLDEFSEQLAQHLRKIFEERILGPELPPVSRVKQLYIRKMVLKIENTLSQYKVNETLAEIQQAFTQNARYRSVVMFYDIDPL